MARGTSEDPLKAKIRMIVDAYKMQYPYEYQLLCDAVDMKRKMATDPEFATMVHDKNTHNRALYEISDTLSTMLILGLSDADLVWYKTKEGARWFAREFPEFRIPNKI